MKHESRAPLIIAFVLLVLPLLYVGSYLALVVPDGYEHRSSSTANGSGYIYLTHYRIPGRPVERFFWPLEQIDRFVRPSAWSSLTSGGLSNYSILVVPDQA